MEMEVKMEQEENLIPPEMIKNEENIKIEFISPDGVTSRIDQNGQMSLRTPSEFSELSANPVSLRTLGGWSDENDDGLIPVYYPEGSKSFPCPMCSETFESLEKISEHFLAKESCQTINVPQNEILVSTPWGFRIPDSSLSYQSESWNV